MTIAVETTPSLFHREQVNLFNLYPHPYPPKKKEEPMLTYRNDKKEMSVLLFRLLFCKLYTFL